MSSRTNEAPKVTNLLLYFIRLTDVVYAVILFRPRSHMDLSLV